MKLDKMVITTNKNDGRVEIRRRRKKTLYQASTMNNMESLNYKLIDNEPLRIYYKHTNLRARDARRLAAKWFIYFVQGLVLGFLVFGIRRAVDALNNLNYNTIDALIGKGHRVAAFFAYFGFNMGYTFIAAITVYLAGPIAGGAGIAEVKGYLNGVVVVGAMSLKTFVGKVISITFAYASCLALGPEGPFIHIGALVGAGLSAAKSRTLGKLRLPGVFETFRQDREQRDFISSGAAAGISAAFGAPIGGVLYALEEASSFWSRELTWRTYFGCMMAAFSVNFIPVAINIFTENSATITSYGLIGFGFSRNYLYRWYELLPFAILGVLGGLLGGIFVRMNVYINRWRRDTLGPNRNKRLFEVMLVGFVTCVMVFGTSTLFDCIPISDIEYYGDVCEKQDDATIPWSVFCADGYYNPLANLIVVPQDVALTLLFARAKNMFSPQALAVYLILYFSLTTITSGLSIAAGLFVPMMLIGAAFGQLTGYVMRAIIPHIDPAIDISIYALVGSTAMMSGFSRITVSLCVIVVELTGNTQYLLPIMVSVIFAKWTGDGISKSIYEEISDLKSIPFLENHPPHKTYQLRITDVMEPNVVCIQEVDKVSRIVEVLRSCKHNGFPVISRDSNDLMFTYRGFIERKTLLIMLDRQQYHLMGHEDRGILDYDVFLGLTNRKWQLENISLPSAIHQDMYEMDVRPYMDMSQVTVQDTFSYMSAYKVFQLQALRHLPVLNAQHQVVGIVTRQDLLQFHFDH